MDLNFFMLRKLTLIVVLSVSGTTSTATKWRTVEIPCSTTEYRGV